EGSPAEYPRSAKREPLGREAGGNVPPREPEAACRGRGPPPAGAPESPGQTRSPCRILNLLGVEPIGIGDPRYHGLEALAEPRHRQSDFLGQFRRAQRSKVGMAPGVASQLDPRTSD